MTNLLKQKKFVLLGNHAQLLVNLRGVLLQDIKALGYEIHAVAPDFDQSFKAQDFLADNAIIMHQVNFSRAGLDPFSNLYSILKLFLLMRKIRPDFFLTYTVKPVILGGLAAWMANVPHRIALITGLGYGFTGNLTGKRRLISSILRMFYRLALNKSEIVFFQNPDDETLFRKEKILSDKIPSYVVNGSGIDLTYFTPASFPDGGDLRFLMIARLLGDKGVREYVKAAQIIKGDFPETEFHLVGGVDRHNPDGINLEEIEGWKKEKNIIWYGEVEDVRPFIKNCHVFVLPSYREGTPHSVLQALAMGRAIITTDTPGCRETVIDGENGFLVPVADAEALSVKIKIFLEQQKLIKIFGMASQALAKKRYDVKKVNQFMVKMMGLVGS